MGVNRTGTRDDMSTAVMTDISGWEVYVTYTVSYVLTHVTTHTSSFPVISYSSLMVGILPNLRLTCLFTILMYGFSTMTPFLDVRFPIISSHDARFFMSGSLIPRNQSSHFFPSGYFISTDREISMISMGVKPHRRSRAMIDPTDVPTYLVALATLSIFLYRHPNW